MNVHTRLTKKIPNKKSNPRNKIKSNQNHTVVNLPVPTLPVPIPSTLISNSISIAPYVSTKYRSPRTIGRIERPAGERKGKVSSGFNILSGLTIKMQKGGLGKKGGAGLIKAGATTNTVLICSCNPFAFSSLTIYLPFSQNSKRSNNK